ncbi:PepSY-like domain-containing protein [Sphingobacterium detergens]|uniref:Putative PepSY-like beta-lactamase-inhibitor n=1 Tax=Sphingobacterium detergens TaxID=1145106 RepID=A0A420ALJ4_SPHD1|nr:PepSY-like domain-containing protein [Sphingobacterium detergens]RKE45308.1 putative PepSY-like beta-lactamase-inhibitor [Sphingobacterium detergens]
MNVKMILSACIFALSTIGASAQDILQSEVPAVVVNSFQQKFPKAKGVDWELKAGLYEAEFETGLFGTDHEVWIQSNGKIVRHKEELAKNDLPKAVIAKVKKDFSGYRIEDIKKITEEQKITYAFEVKSRTEEWKLVVDTQGNILGKIRD